VIFFLKVIPWNWSTTIPSSVL